MTRFGFGNQTDESDGGLAQFEHGHVDVSGAALKFAIENYPEEPPKAALGRMLAEGVEDDENGGEDAEDDE